MNDISSAPAHGRSGGKARLFISWSVVGVPLGWGVWQVLVKSLVLFGA